jgi:hypothetical protein
MSGASGEVDASRNHFDEEQDVQPLQRDRVGREEINREQALRLRLQELRVVRK